MKRSWYLAAVAVGLLALVPVGSVVYQGSSCGNCHEIAGQVDALAHSSHRSVACGSCHGGTFTMDARFHLNNVKRLVTHWSGAVPEKITLRHSDVFPVVERCRSCHRQEFAAWQSGPHGTTFQKIFLDKEHNGKRLPMDDCLRCHGMHFGAGMRDLLRRNAGGSYELVDASLATRPAIPCLACHSIHRPGEPSKQRAGAAKKFQPSLALFDVRSRKHLPVSGLAIPAMFEGERRVRMSPDQRQAMCYQCHAPLDAAQAGTGDDRTPLGVHEGLSCIACHAKHTQDARASCATCHPRLSNCGLDVEKMDTTFVSKTSKHNIHTVKCLDCHPNGVPRKRV